jgi:hypothetical protein
MAMSSVIVVENSILLGLYKPKLASIKPTNGEKKSLPVRISTSLFGTSNY